MQRPTQKIIIILIIATGSTARLQRFIHLKTLFKETINKRGTTRLKQIKLQKVNMDNCTANTKPLILQEVLSI